MELDHETGLHCARGQKTIHPLDALNSCFPFTRFSFYQNADFCSVTIK